MNVPHHLRSSLIKWISKRLRDECGDSSDAVSKNIMNVLRNDTKDKVKMKTMIASQLEEYSSNADSFAEDLFKTIESRSFVEMEDESVDSDDSDRDDRRGRYESERSRGEKRSRGGEEESKDEEDEVEERTTKRIRVEKKTNVAPVVTSSSRVHQVPSQRRQPPPKRRQSAQQHQRRTQQGNRRNNNNMMMMGNMMPFGNGNNNMAMQQQMMMMMMMQQQQQQQQQKQQQQQSSKAVDVRNLKTLRVSKIPKFAMRMDKLGAHFGKFGNVVNLKLEPQSNEAYVMFERHAGAARALKSPKPVCNNRFIEVRWSNKEAADVAVSDRT